MQSVENGSAKESQQLTFVENCIHIFRQPAVSSCSAIAYM